MNFQKWRTIPISLFPGLLLQRSKWSYWCAGAQPALHFGGGKFSRNVIRWRHRAYSTVVQLFRKRSHIIIMYFYPQTRSPQYKDKHSAQCWSIKTDKTEWFTTALEAESPMSSEISDFTPYAHACTEQHSTYTIRWENLWLGFRIWCLAQCVELVFMLQLEKEK